MRRGDPFKISGNASTLRRRAVSGAGITALTQFCKFFLQMGAQIVLARLLDPAQFGLVAMVAPVLGLVLSLNDMGLGQAVVQRAELTHRQLSAMFWICVGIGLGLTLLAMAAAPLVALLYAEPRTRWVMVASASLIVLSSLSVVPQALLNRQMRFNALAAIEFSAMALGLGSGILAAWLGAGYWSLVIAQAVNSATTLLLAWPACGWLPGRPAREPGIGAMVRFGAHIMGANLATHLSMSADQMIVGAVNGKVALGLYDRSYNLVVKPLMQVMAPASRVAVPLLSRLLDTPGRYGRAYLLMLQLTQAACVPGILAAVLAAQPLVLMLLGDKWAAMVPVFFWIGLGGTASALSASTYWLLTSQGRAREQMRLSVLVALISVAAFALGSVWGVVGVARVSALSFLFVQTPLLVWGATRRGPVTLALLRRGLWPLLLASAAAAAATLAVLQEVQSSHLLQVVAAFAVSYAAFMATLLAQPAGRRLVADARALLPQRHGSAQAATTVNGGLLHDSV